MILPCRFQFLFRCERMWFTCFPFVYFSVQVAVAGPSNSQHKKTVIAEVHPTPSSESNTFKVLHSICHFIKHHKGVFFWKQSGAIIFRLILNVTELKTRSMSQFSFPPRAPKLAKYAIISTV